MQGVNWSVVSYFLRYFSSTSTEQISPIQHSDGPKPTVFRRAVVILIEPPHGAASLNDHIVEPIRIRRGCQAS
jgi:hypothetical protein